jgi:hypothetical protein
MYLGLLKENIVNLMKCVCTGSYNSADIARFVCILYFS